MALDVIGPLDGDQWRFTSPALGSLQFRPPTPKSASDTKVQDVLYAVHRADDRARAIVNDAALSREGKRMKLTESTAPAVTAASDAQRWAAARRTERAAAIAKLYAAPPAENVGLDIETRAAYLALPERARHDLDAAMARGEADATLQALLRAPVPQAIPELVRELWRRRVEAANANILAQHAANDEDDTRVDAAARMIGTALQQAIERQ